MFTSNPILKNCEPVKSGGTQPYITYITFDTMVMGVRSL